LVTFRELLITPIVICVKIGNANILLYHAPTHIQSSTLRHPGNHALIAMMSMEQPKYSPVLANLKYLQDNVDLMVTYSLSDIYPGTTVRNMPITYWPLNIVSPQAVLQPARPLAEKTGYGTGNQSFLASLLCSVYCVPRSVPLTLSPQQQTWHRLTEV
jgi:hypothetical protein